MTTEGCYADGQPKVQASVVADDDGALNILLIELNIHWG